jgi:hypothetical protein
LISISSPLRPNRDEPQAGQKWRFLYSAVAPAIVTAPSGKIAEVSNTAP